MWRRLEADALVDLIDSLEIGVFAVELDAPGPGGGEGILRIVAANPKMQRIAGAALEQLLGRRVIDAMPGPTAATIEDRLHLSLAFNRPMEFVERASFIDGAYWWQFSAAPMAQPDGRRLVTCGVVDISPPQRAADHLQVVAERFWLALQAAQDGIWDWNLTENNLWLSPQWKAQVGYDDHELEDTSEAWDGLLCEEDGRASAGIRERLRPFLRAPGSEFALITHLRRRDGGVIVAHVRGTKVIDETGQVIRLVGAQTDITKRALAERQLAASEARFRAIAANVPGVIFQWRDGGKNGGDRGFNYVSPRCIQLYGLDPADLEEDWRHLPVHPEDEPRWRAMLDEAAERRRPWSFEGRFLLHDGRTPWWRCIARPMESDQGPVYIGLFVDIDQQKQAELALVASQQRFRDFADASSDWMWETDGQDRLIWLSGEYQAHTGLAIDSMIGSSDWAFAGTPAAIDPDVLPAYRRLLADRGAFTGFEYRTRRGDGGDLWVRASGKPRFDPQGRFLGYRGVAKNVTLEKQSEQELRLAAMVFDTTRDAILITDNENRIVKVNPSFTSITGYSQEEIIGQNPKILSSGRQTEGYYRVMWDTLQTEGRWQGELWNRKKDGSFYLQWASIAVERDEHGLVKHYIAAFQDITQRRANEERLLYHANFDTLTGLPNRRLFNDRLEQALIRARRGVGKVAVLFLDLDGFKYVNDTLGHAVGDRLLIEVAGRLRHCIRESDTVARFGGDEFTVFLSDVPDAREVALTGYRILEALAEPMTLEGQEVICTTSIGASIFPDDAADAEALCRQADAAMYDAKARGKNDMAFFTEELNRKAMSRLQMENNLRRAIERSEFILHFQPKVLIADATLVGVEALVRWAHPERGMVSPGEFIPIAEESDVIHQLGEWVLRQTCWSAREWVDTGNAPIRFAFNVSPVQFARGNFVSLLQRVMRETEIEPGWLEVELTEGTLMRDPAAAEEALNQIRSMGVHVSIDDFGTGYSSLSYLTSLPLDSLKIDQSFVRKITESEKAAAIASSIVGIARSLKLTTVAEGVETVEQLAFLKDAGCDQAQGYLFSRPISFVSLANWAHTRDAGRGGAD